MGIAIVLLAGACQDATITQPAGPSAPSATSPTIRGAITELGDVTIHEITTTRASADAAPVRHERVRKMSERQVGVSHGDAAPTAPDARLSPPEGPDAAWQTPLPTLRLPVQKAIGVCLGAPAWQERMLVNAEEGLVASAVGVGDGPASEIRIERQGTPVATVRRTWVRTSDSWQLVRQETTTPDGRYQQQLTVERTTVAGNARQDALPTVQCQDRRASVLPASANHADPLIPWAQRSGDAGTASGTSPIATADPFDLASAGAGPVAGTPRAEGDYCTDAQARCEKERIAMVQAEIVVVTASAAVGIACGAPEPFQPAACATALAYWGKCVGEYYGAHAAYSLCLRTVPPPECNCGTAEFGAPQSSPASTAQAAGGSVRVTGSYCDSGSSGGTGGGGVWTCYYLVLYDRDTGQIYDVELIGCEFVQE